MNLLRDVFGQVIIPQEVYNEVTTGTHPAATAVLSATWIEVLSVSDSQKVSALRVATKLGLGTLLLAKQKGLIESVKELLDALIAQDTRISQRLYQYALTTAQE